MSIKEIVKKQVDYNYWANERMVEWLKSLDRELLYKETPSSFPGIDLTIQHLVHCQNFWLAVLTGRDYTNLDERIRVREADWSMKELLGGARRMIDTYGSYSENELLAAIRAPDSTQSRYEFILHVVSHGAYHRGQIVTMARCLGVTRDIPTTDYDAYLWTITSNPK